MGNLSRDAINNGECVILLDFIKNCELSDDVIGVIPKNKVLIIDTSDFNKMQWLGYNEVGFSNDVFVQYDNAKKQVTQLRTLLNAIQGTDIQPLTPKMERYLTSAGLVVFISGGSIENVFRVLQNHVIRNDFINKVPKSQMENMKEYIDYLHELDEYNKAGEVVGTNYNSVVGIIDRLNKLKANTYMELMLKHGIENNIDLPPLGDNWHYGVFRYFDVYRLYKSPPSIRWDDEAEKWEFGKEELITVIYL